ncbi:MAG: chemotaxis protein CheW [Deltaproteobacteria bacterium]|nr:chemotaxis protein CheW [Deltaproteobacteria bacterium]
MDEDIIIEFTIEAKDHLSTLEEDLLRLEGQMDGELVNKVFRVIHSIKGGAAFLGLVKLKDLAHVMETLLSMMRAGDIRPEHQYIDALLQGGDMIASMMDDIHHSNEMDISRNLALLTALLNGESQSPSSTWAHSAATAYPQTDVAAPASGLKGVEAMARYELNHLPPNYRFLYLLKYDLNQLEHQRITPVTLLKELLTQGEVVDGVLVPPTQDLRLGLPSGHMAFDVLFATWLDMDFLEVLARLPSENITQLDLAAIQKGGRLPAELDTSLSDLVFVSAPSGSAGAGSPETRGSVQAVAPQSRPLRGDAAPRINQTPTKGRLSDEIRSPASGPSSLPLQEMKPDSQTSLFAHSLSSQPEAPVPMASSTPVSGNPSERRNEPNLTEITKPSLPGPVPIVPKEAEEIDFAGRGANSLFGKAGGQTTAVQRSGGDSVETVRINVAILDKLMTLAGELVLLRNRFVRWVDKTNPVSRALAHGMDIVTTEMQESIMATRMQPVGNVFGKFPRVVRDLSRSLQKEIKITIIGSEVELDKAILEALVDPLTHLVRNSCDHGIESPEIRRQKGKNPEGEIVLHAYHQGGQINIEIQDDGAGIQVGKVKAKALQRGLKTEAELAEMTEREVYFLIMQPGFSTNEEVSELSGRGVGMDVVKTTIDGLGGDIEIKTIPGKGTTFLMKLPLTLAIIPSLIVETGDERYAIPQVNVEELVSLYADEISKKIEYAGDREVYRLRDRLLPIIRLNEVLAHRQTFTPETRLEIIERYRREMETLKDAARTDHGASGGGMGEVKRLLSILNIAVLKFGANRVGLVVEKILGMEEIVVKPMHPTMKKLACYAGATVMGDGKVALILDVQGLSRHTGVAALVEDMEEDTKTQRGETTPVLLFKYGPAETFALPLSLIKRIERIAPAQIEKVGDREYVTVDKTSTVVIRVDEYMNVSSAVQKDEMFLLLPKHIRLPMGIMVSSLVDIEEVDLNLNQKAHVEDGIMGTLLVEDKMVLLMDLHRMAERTGKGSSAGMGAAVQSRQGKKRVLVVEDTPFFRNLVASHLEQNGFEVVRAENGREGLSRLNESTFDLVLSDIQMPVMDGMEMVKQIKLSQFHKDIPSIALTSLDSSQDKEKIMASGFDQHLVKLDKAELLRAVQQTLATP